MRKLVLGTRGSPLALWQARHVADSLRAAHGGLTVEEKIFRTEGDLQQTAPLGPGDRGVFVRAIEDRLLAGEIDIAVHSLKDLPTSQPEGLVIAAVPEREDPRDCLLSLEGWSFEEMPRSTVVATGSFRRRMQLVHARPGLKIVPVRGNVDSRIRKLKEDEYGALVLAMAGVKRLKITHPPGVPIPADLCLPAVGQGALAVQTRENDEDARGMARALEHAASRVAVRGERSFLRKLGGGCLAPATAFAVVEGGTMRLEAVVGDPGGVKLLRDRESGAIEDAVAMGEELAGRMLSAGAARLMRPDG
jgi:hydroxymethylbilane synthase